MSLIYPAVPLIQSRAVASTDAVKMRVVTGSQLAALPQLERCDPASRRDIRIVAAVLPFKVNNYVIDELIDWDDVPDDPLYRLTFPHRDMLPVDVFDAVARVVDAGATRTEIRRVAEAARQRLNPHPGGQLELNVPIKDGLELRGLQHKYRETVLVFPAQGQTCHSYCGYCFRWAQFVGMPELRQAAYDPRQVVAYLREAPWVSDVLFTGGDPLVMSAEVLARYVEPVLEPGLEHIRNIRFGTKALSYNPYRFLTEPDADGLLRLFARCVESGKHVAVMAHFSHPRELETSAVVKAIRRIQSTGAIIRSQAPIVQHVNNAPKVWADLWRQAVRLGIVPYYMFVERDTGAQEYFALPLTRALEVYRNALASVSGLERTARGPVMSATPGKILIDGISTVAGSRVFVCRFLQARNPEWVGVPFFATYDADARWFDDLRPAFGEARFWFQDDPVQDWRHSLRESST